jgi:hypothetical protein
VLGYCHLDRHAESGIGTAVLLNQVTSGEGDWRSCELFAASSGLPLGVTRLGAIKFVIVPPTNVA